MENIRRTDNDKIRRSFFTHFVKIGVLRCIQLDPFGKTIHFAGIVVKEGNDRVGLVIGVFQSFGKGDDTQAAADNGNFFHNTRLRSGFIDSLRDIPEF